MDRDPEEFESLEQAELRKRLLEQADAQRSHRSEVEEEPVRVAHEPERQWKPPNEAVMAANTGKLVFRLIVFALVIAGTYLVVRQGSGIFLAPELDVIGPVTPMGRLAPGAPLTVGVEVRNARMIDGAAFVVAVLPDGTEVEGEVVAVPGMETVTATVQIDLGVGAHVISLIIFDGWRDPERLQTYSGIPLRIGRREVALESFAVPESVTSGDSLSIEFIGRNEGQFAEFMLPRVQFRPEEGGDPVEGVGYPVEFNPGDSVAVQFFIDSAILPVGRYFAELLALSDDGVILGQARYPEPLEVSD